MGELEKKLIIQALGKHEKIFPCAHKESMTDCFTVIGNQLYLWFNTEDNSTHVVIEDLSNSARRPLH